MSYLIAIGTSVCGATAIVATAPVINAKKSEVAYAIANITSVSYTHLTLPTTPYV